MIDYGQILDAADKINRWSIDRIANEARKEAEDRAEDLMAQQVTPEAYNKPVGWKYPERLYKKLRKIQTAERYTYKERNVLRLASDVTGKGTSCNQWPTVSDTLSAKAIASRLEQVFIQYGGKLEKGELTFFTNDIYLSPEAYDGRAHIGILEVVISVPDLSLVRVYQSPASTHDNSYTHPHVSQGDHAICYGYVGERFKVYAHGGYVYELAEFLMSLLNTYNDGSPLNDIENWLGGGPEDGGGESSGCYNCGAYTDLSDCCGCDYTHCGECHCECGWCGSHGYCGECHLACRQCNTGICPDCTNRSRWDSRRPADRQIRIYHHYCDGCTEKCPGCYYRFPKTMPGLKVVVEDPSTYDKLGLVYCVDCAITQEVQHGVKLGDYKGFADAQRPLA